MIMIMTIITIVIIVMIILRKIANYSSGPIEPNVLQGAKCTSLSGFEKYLLASACQ